jgi:glyceraldehyde 3-phosphate dehydrogenase
MGRIGRSVLRAAVGRSALEVVAVNDLIPPKDIAHLFKRDSVHGPFAGEVAASDGAIAVGGKSIRVLSERDPAKLGWSALGVDFVLESTGFFTARSDAAKHLEAGARRVVISAPAKGEVDLTVVLGVNDDRLRPEHKVISNASCTTNCLAPVVKVLHERFGVTRGLMTTVHAYTADQGLVDTVHSDPRRARAAALNIVPTSTGASRAVGLVVPELKGKLDGLAMRVPVPDGSVVDLVAEVERSTTTDAVNAAFGEAADGPLSGILEVSHDPLVSTDIIGDPRSSIVDAELTQVIGGTFVKVIAWYDNEWGYANRCVDLLERLAA